MKLPPLRERKEDIYLLARVFAARYGRPRLTFTFSFLVALLHYDWPFNVRELESCLKRGAALATTDALDTPQLPDAIAELMKSYGLRKDHRGDAPSWLPPPPQVPRGAGAPAPMGLPGRDGSAGLAQDSAHGGRAARRSSRAIEETWRRWGASSGRSGCRCTAG